MARSKKRVRDASTLDMFPDLLQLAQEEGEEALEFLPSSRAVWTHQKAQLIAAYLYRFVMVTKHGTYIDGFAGPHSPENPETWAAKLVIEKHPRWIRNFFLCEIDPKKVQALDALWEMQSPPKEKESRRQCNIMPGDFNVRIDDILASGVIGEKEATFALLDQWTNECHWSSVEKLARHKKIGNKIEQFYFLAVKWLHRAMGGITTLSGEEKIRAWWGKDNWRVLQNMSQRDICDVMRGRFKSELGYRYAYPFPIYGEEDGHGSVMYYMIHATDHSEAPKLMNDAYRKILPGVQTGEQFSFDVPGFEKLL